MNINKEHNPKYNPYINAKIENLDIIEENNNNNLNLSNKILLESKHKESKRGFPLKELNIKNKEIVINKEITKVINYKNKKSTDIAISQADRLSYVCCCGEKKIVDNPKNIIFKLIKVAESELEKKCDIVEIIRVIDQFRLFKKFILNEGQCKLLNNRELKILTEQTPIIDVNLEEMKTSEMFSYFKTRKDSGLLSQIDMLLLNYLPKELIVNIKTEFNI